MYIKTTVTVQAPYKCEGYFPANISTCRKLTVTYKHFNCIFVAKKTLKLEAQTKRVNVVLLRNPSEVHVRRSRFHNLYILILI